MRYGPPEAWPAPLGGQAQVWAKLGVASIVSGDTATNIAMTPGRKRRILKVPFRLPDQSESKKQIHRTLSGRSHHTNTSELPRRLREALIILLSRRHPERHESDECSLNIRRLPLADCVALARRCAGGGLSAQRLIDIAPEVLDVFDSGR